MNNVKIQKIMTTASLIVAVILLMATSYMFLQQKTIGLMSTLKAAFVPLFLLANAILTGLITVNNLVIDAEDSS
jgi:ABC-type multidrug transport system permease subunit